MLRPVHGFTGITVSLPAVGVRYTVQLVAPDRGPARADVVHRILPRFETTSAALDDGKRGRLVAIEMRFDQRRRAASVWMDDRPFVEAYPGFGQFLNYPGVTVSVGQLESDAGEGVIGDVDFDIA